MDQCLWQSTRARASVGCYLSIIEILVFSPEPFSAIAPSALEGLSAVPNFDYDSHKHGLWQDGCLVLREALHRTRLPWTMVSWNPVFAPWSSPTPIIEQKRSPQFIYERRTRKLIWDTAAMIYPASTTYLGTGSALGKPRRPVG